MGAKHIRLIYGTLALLLLYVGGNMVYRLLVVKQDEGDPRTQALIQRGQAIAETCAACHYLDQRTHFVGPNLVSLIGRPIGRAEGYEYSEALQKQNDNWTPDKLSAFLANPQQFAPGTKMALAGWPPADVQAIVAYLQSKE